MPISGTILPSPRCNWSLSRFAVCLLSSLLYVNMTVKEDFPEMYLFIHYCWLNSLCSNTLGCKPRRTHTAHTFHCMCHQLEWKRKQWTLFTLHHARNNTPWALWIICFRLLFFFSLNNLLNYRRFTFLVIWSFWSLDILDYGICWCKICILY